MSHKAVFFNLEPWEKEYVSKSPKLAAAATGATAAAGITLGFEDYILASDRLPAGKDFDIACVFAVSKMDAAAIAALPNLKFIAALSTGYDNIDLAACAARGIAVSNVPAYGENTVAEYAFGLILELARKICESHDRVRAEGSFRLDGLRGFDLAGKTLGVVGTGHIGRHVIRMAKGFNMNVIAFDAYPDEAFAKESGFAYAPFNDLLAQSDIISFHVPYMPATHHLLNKENIGLVKKGAYIVNTSRGAVIETDALVRALKGGALGGAGLDVLEEEGMIIDELELLAADRVAGHDLKTVLEDHALIDMPNVIVTPHNAFNTTEALTRILETTIDNVVAFANGAPINLVK
jgi:D-lactate dehydrogenase